MYNKTSIMVAGQRAGIIYNIYVRLEINLRLWHANNNYWTYYYIFNHAT